MSCGTVVGFSELLRPVVGTGSVKIWLVRTRFINTGRAYSKYRELIILIWMLENIVDLQLFQKVLGDRQSVRLSLELVLPRHRLGDYTFPDGLEFLVQ